jgi:hypothetical protein
MRHRTDPTKLSAVMRALGLTGIALTSLLQREIPVRPALSTICNTRQIICSSSGAGKTGAPDLLSGRGVAPRPLGSQAGTREV